MLYNFIKVMYNCQHEYRLSDGTGQEVLLLETIEIIPMSPEHVGQIAELEKQCFSLPWSEKAIKTELKNEGAMFFVAKRCNGIAGYIGMHKVLDECYIANIAVFPEYRRQGIGDRILSFAENTARQKGCSFISLEVRVSNLPAIALYEKRGYLKQGERKDFYSNPKENALIMTKYFNEV